MYVLAIVSAKSHLASNMEHECESLMVKETHRVVWIILSHCAQHWDRSFIVCWPTRPQSPVNILLDPLRLVSELCTVEKFLH